MFPSLFKPKKQERPPVIIIKGYVETGLAKADDKYFPSATFDYEKLIIATKLSTYTEQDVLINFSTLQNIVYKFDWGTPGLNYHSGEVILRFKKDVIKDLQAKLNRIRLL